VFDVETLICGPPFDTLPEDPAERATVLMEAEESFRLFYRMVEAILTAKEDMERRRQTVEARAAAVED